MALVAIRIGDDAAGRGPYAVTAFRIYSFVFARRRPKLMAVAARDAGTADTGYEPNVVKGELDSCGFMLGRTRSDGILRQRRGQREPVLPLSSPRSFAASGGSAGAVHESRPETLDYFLTERYCLYTTTRGGALGRREIRYQPWPLADAQIAVGTIGRPRPALCCQQPLRFCLSPRGST
jgi:hypothetical protein